MELDGLIESVSFIDLAAPTITESQNKQEDHDKKNNNDDDRDEEYYNKLNDDSLKRLHRILEQLSSGCVAYNELNNYSDSMLTRLLRSRL